MDLKDIPNIEKVAENYEDLIAKSNHSFQDKDYRKSQEYDDQADQIITTILMILGLATLGSSRQWLNLNLRSLHAKHI
jgi:hypothetical protein